MKAKLAKFYDFLSRDIDLKKFKYGISYRPGVPEIEAVAEIKNKIRRFLNMGWIIIREFVFQSKTHDLNTMAGSLTYSFMLSVVPLLSIAIFFFQQYGQVDKLIDETLVPFITSHFSHTAGEQLSIYLNAFVQKAKTSLLGSIAFSTFLITVVNLLIGIEKSFNEIFAAKNNRPLWRRILNYWTLISITPFVVTLSSVKTAEFLSQYAWTGELIHSLGFLGTPFAIFIKALGFIALFIIIPNRNMPIKALFIGGVTAAILFQMLQRLNIFLTRSLLIDSTATHLYGTAPLIAIAFIFWIKLVWQVILYSACLVASLTNIMEITKPSEPERSPDDGLIHCSQIFSIICREFKKSPDGVTIHQIREELQMRSAVVAHWLLWLEKRRVVFAGIVNGNKKYFPTAAGLKAETNPSYFIQEVLLRQFNSGSNEKNIQSDTLLQQVTKIFNDFLRKSN